MTRRYRNPRRATPGERAARPASGLANAWPKSRRVWPGATGIPPPG